MSTTNPARPLLTIFPEIHYPNWINFWGKNLKTPENFQMRYLVAFECFIAGFLHKH